MSIGVMLFCPFTGKPRHPSDIQSDPKGILVWDGEEPLRAYIPPAQRTWVGLTDEMVTAAARALNKRQSEDCGVDKNDHWKLYGDDIKEDARAALEAAYGIKENT